MALAVLRKEKLFILLKPFEWLTLVIQVVSNHFEGLSNTQNSKAYIRVGTKISLQICTKFFLYSSFHRANGWSFLQCWGFGLNFGGLQCVQCLDTWDLSLGSIRCVGGWGNHLWYPLDSLRALIASSVLPEPNFPKTRFQGFWLLLDEPKAEPAGESGAPSDSVSGVPLSWSPLHLRPSLLAGLALVPWYKRQDCDVKYVVLVWRWRWRGHVVVTSASNASYTPNRHISGIQAWGLKGLNRKERCPSWLNDPACPTAAWRSTPSCSSAGWRQAKHKFKILFPAKHLEKRHPAKYWLIPGYQGITLPVTYLGICRYKSG